MRYEHTVFQRNIGSSSTSEITSSPLSSATVTKLAECWRLCTGQSNCASLLYDDRTSNCSLLGNIIDVRNVNQDLEYFVVKSSAQYMDIIRKSVKDHCVYTTAIKWEKCLSLNSVLIQTFELYQTFTFVVLWHSCRFTTMFIFLHKLKQVWLIAPEVLDIRISLFTNENPS